MSFMDLRVRWPWLLLVWLLLVRCQLPTRFGQGEVADEGGDVATQTDQAQADLLAAIRERGYIKVGVRVWPDPQFQPPLYRAPQISLVGYEVDLAWALAEGLGVELEMSESDPRLLTTGNWGHEWDIALAWLSITDQTQQALIFSTPYAYDAGQVAVHRDSTLASYNALASKRVGVPAFTLYQNLLQGEAFAVEGAFLTQPLPANVTAIPYWRDGDALWQLAEGHGVKLEAVLHSRLVVVAAIHGEEKLPLKPLGEPLFWHPIGVAFDRSGLPSERLRQEIDTIITQLHHDQTLARSSLAWYGEDISRH